MRLDFLLHSKDQKYAPWYCDGISLPQRSACKDCQEHFYDPAGGTVNLSKMATMHPNQRLTRPLSSS
uniref:Uncharacterized protein n=1 Tax=Knipowitschia caucasica TaxID=637954 RepID=A0AAV2MRP4_KNICA